MIVTGSDNHCRVAMAAQWYPNKLARIGDATVPPTACPYAGAD
jgi:hypothetical protein